MAPLSYLAKIYRLGENDKEWQDCGVVRVRCSFVERLNEMALVLVTEDEPKRVVLEAPISLCEYRRDVMTIISWQDTLDLFHPIVNGIPEPPQSNNVPNEVALSFETIDGCSKVWEELCSIQCRVSADYRVDSIRNGGDDEFEMGSHINQEESASPSQMASGKLTSENLPQYVQTLRSAGQYWKGKLIGDLVGKDPEKMTLTQLLEFFVQVDASEEGAKRTEELEMLFELMKMIALLDDQQVIELMLTDECFEKVAGCLENDPHIAFRPTHRRFLREEARFNQVVPIKNQSVQNMITQRFRLGFLRDVLLPRFLDELSFKRLTLMDTKLSVDIAQALHQDDEFVSQLLEVLWKPAGQERANAIAFLSELSSLSQKNMQIQARSAFYRTFTERDKGLFQVCETILADPFSTAKERLDVGEILFLALKHDTNLVRNRITKVEEEIQKIKEGDGLEHKNGKNLPQSLLGLLVVSVISDHDAGVQAQGCQLLELLLDPETVVSSSKEDDPFFGRFYKSYFQPLVSVLEKVSAPSSSSPSSSSSSKSNGENNLNNNNHHHQHYIDHEIHQNAAHLVSGLLSFCVQTHGYLVREVITNHVVVPSVLTLLGCKEKHLVLDAIRFVRTCIGMRETFYYDYFTQYNLFDPVIEAFVKNGSKNNLINSTVIDLLEFIKVENIRPLVSHIVTRFEKELRPISSYVNTFVELEKLHVSNLTIPPTLATISKSPSTQSLNSGSSPGGDQQQVKRQHRVLVGQQPTRVTKSSIFGESRPLRDDDDESFFDDDVDSPSPPKRSRIYQVPTDVDS